MSLPSLCGCLSVCVARAVRTEAPGGHGRLLGACLPCAPACHAAWHTQGLRALSRARTPEAVFRPVSSQAPEANASSVISARPAQEEQLATPPGKVATVSSRSPRCPRNQAALRHSKAFSPSPAPCSSGEAQVAPIGHRGCTTGTPLATGSVQTLEPLPGG